MKIGIVGAENSHTAAIARLLNIERKIKGVRVEYVWGETKAFAADAAKKGEIPNIVARPEEMLDKIDAVVVDHRHPKYHLAAARPFVERGLPTFIDKPLCFRAKEGKDFLKFARRHGAPVTSFSVLPHQSSFRRFLKRLEGAGRTVAAASYGPADIKSPHGGVFFYGIHQVDMILHAFGHNVSSVQVLRNRQGAVATMFYPSGLIVAVHLIKEGSRTFLLTAVGEDEIVHMPIKMDASPYLKGVKEFVRMFKTGEEPLGDERMLRPVQVLEAMAASIKSGKKETVRK